VPCSASHNFMTASRSEAVRASAKTNASKYPRKLSEPRALPLLSACPHVYSLRDHRHPPGAPPLSLSMPQSSAPEPPANPVQDGPKPTGLGALLKRAGGGAPAAERCEGLQGRVLDG
jgi:hypothetical protein